MTYLTTCDVAKDLSLSKRTIQVYCQEGFLPAKLIWTSGNRIEYEVDGEKYLEWKQKHFKGVRRGACSKRTRITKDKSKEDLKNTIDDWLNWCSTGKLTGKPIAPRTSKLYDYYLNLYFNQLGKYPKKPLISIENAREVLGSFSAKSYSTKLNVYSALQSFAKYLSIHGQLEDDFKEKLKTLRPKRLFPAKKTVLNESQLEKMIQAVDNCSNYSKYCKLLNITLIKFLAQTGLRANEVCSLKLDDIDLESGIVKVNLGKGNKNRQVGINKNLNRALIEYLKIRLDYSRTDWFFVNRAGTKLCPLHLCKRINRIGKKIGVEISPHGLRRTFVTLNTNRGQPLVHLQIACGHNDISTTRSYCMTTENEVIEAMKNW